MKFKPDARQIKDYLSFLKSEYKREPPAYAVARKLFEQGESDQSIFKYLTINQKLNRLNALEIIRELNEI